MYLKFFLNKIFYNFYAVYDQDLFKAYFFFNRTINIYFSLINLYFINLFIMLLFFLVYLTKFQYLIYLFLNVIIFLQYLFITKKDSVFFLFFGFGFVIFILTNFKSYLYFYKNCFQIYFFFIVNLKFFIFIYKFIRLFIKEHFYLLMINHYIYLIS